MRLGADIFPPFQMHLNTTHAHSACHTPAALRLAAVAVLALIMHSRPGKWHMSVIGCHCVLLITRSVATFPLVVWRTFVPNLYAGDHLSSSTYKDSAMVCKMCAKACFDLAAELDDVTGTKICCQLCQL